MEESGEGEREGRGGKDSEFLVGSETFDTGVVGGMAVGS